MRVDKTITIALAADRGFCKQLAVVIASLANSNDGAPYLVYVFHDGYDAALKARIEQSARSNVALQWIDAASPSLNGAILPGYLPPATLFRLRIEDLLPADVDRLVYLDTDTVVMGPLADLWAVDLGGSLLGAVRDATAPWAASPLGLEWSELGVPPDSPYFNAGVLLIPLDRWRTEAVCRRALDLVVARSLKHADQCALNIVAAGDWARLGPRWNLQAGHLAGDGSLAWVTEPRDTLMAAKRDPAIVHFNHSAWARPWEPDSTHPFRDEWFAALDTTAWAGWRPVQDRTRRFAQRVKRAGRVLLRG